MAAVQYTCTFIIHTAYKAENRLYPKSMTRHAADLNTVLWKSLVVIWHTARSIIWKPPFLLLPNIASCMAFKMFSQLNTNGHGLTNQTAEIGCIKNVWRVATGELI